MPAEMQPVQHAPSRQVPPLQLEPSASLPLSTQVAALLAPPGQAVMPVLHSVGLVLHVLPATQLMHAPPEQPLAQVVSTDRLLHRPPLQVPVKYVRAVVALRQMGEGVPQPMFCDE